LIKLLTEKIGSASVATLILLTSYGIIIGDSSIEAVTKLTLLFAEGLLLNYLCFRFSILGVKSNLPLVLFCTLSVLVIPDLSIGDLIYGAVFLGAFFLVFESREQEKLAGRYMIYFGILLGIAQTISNISILLMLPVFILFIQAGTSKPGHFVLSITYFIMILISYSGLLFVMDLPDKIWDLIPQLALDYSVFNSILMKLAVPFIVISLVVHFLSLRGYRFRFPNKSIILNYTMLVQLASSIVIVIISTELNILTYSIMAASITLSFAFAYKQDNIFVNASFASLICICTMSLALFRILIL